MGREKFLKPPDLDNILIYPSYAQMMEDIKLNLDLFSSCQIKIGNTALKKFRHQLREELDVPVDKPVIVTGHQEIFFHPGIWFKYFLIDKIARFFGTYPVNISVDTDSAREISVDVPLRAGNKLSRERIVLISSLNNVPFENIEFPDKQVLDIWRKKVEYALDSDKSFSRFKQNFVKYLDILNRNTENKKITDVLLKSRREYENKTGSELNYKTVKVSEISETEGFKKFVKSIFDDYKNFRFCYNDTLKEYKKRYKIRNPTEPFPYLSENEFPFWQTTGHTREKMYCEKFSTEKIRPKGPILTLFIRLFFADYFIHGTGGAGYEKFNDMFIKRYYNITPFEYGITSLSISLTDKTDINRKKEEIKKFELQKREMRFNPDKFTNAVNSREFNLLAEEKKKIISELSGDNKDKKKMHDRIEDINSCLNMLLKDAFINIEKNIKKIKEQIEEDIVLSYREYPFFLFTAEEVKKKLSSVD